MTGQEEIDAAADRARRTFVEIDSGLPEHVLATLAPWGTLPERDRDLWRAVVLSAIAPLGLCAIRGDHPAHDVVTGSLAQFRCAGREADREPGRSERRRAARYRSEGPYATACETCGALIGHDLQSQHTAWHGREAS